MNYLIRSPFKRRIVSLVDSIGRLIFGKKDGDWSEAIESILLIRLDHLGDVLLTTPAITSLKQQFPQARIVMLIKEWSFEVIQNNPHIDNIIIFNPSWTIAKSE
ncbi:MAG: glycosyltransferase family 9 protein, partial [Candidatus Hodarchaeota archaeon]